MYLSTEKSSLPYSNFLEGLYGNKGCEEFEDKLRPLQTDEVEQECQVTQWSSGWIDTKYLMKCNIFISTNRRVCNACTYNFTHCVLWKCKCTITPPYLTICVNIQPCIIEFQVFLCSLTMWYTNRPPYVLYPNSASNNSLPLFNNKNLAKSQKCISDQGRKHMADYWYILLCICNVYVVYRYNIPIQCLQIVCLSSVHHKCFKIGFPLLFNMFLGPIEIIL